MNTISKTNLFMAVYISILFISSTHKLVSDEENKLSKKEKTVKLISLTRTPELYVDLMLNTIKQSPIPDEDKDLFCKFATVESLAEKFVPVYMDVYDEDELDAMINFYSSETGRNIVSKSFNIVDKIREINLEWELSISSKVKAEKAKKAIENNNK